MRADGWWGQLTDDDLDMIEGESEKLVGALQTRYGWSREEAEREIHRDSLKSTWRPAINERSGPEAPSPP